MISHASVESEGWWSSTRVRRCRHCSICACARRHPFSVCRPNAAISGVSDRFYGASTVLFFLRGTAITRSRMRSIANGCKTGIRGVTCCHRSDSRAFRPVRCPAWHARGREFESRWLQSSALPRADDAHQPHRTAPHNTARLGSFADRRCESGVSKSETRLNGEGGIRSPRVFATRYLGQVYA